MARDTTPAATSTASNSAPEPSAPTGGVSLTPLPPDLVSPQLTVRAVVTGMILGGLLSICNIYLGLKIGWGTNMSVTGILLAFAFWSAVSAVLGPARGRFNILENNINQSSCSAAAAVSSAGLVAPIPAMTIMTGETLSWPVLALWVFAVCMVGITVATGLRRQMVVVDQLPFPGGIACAQTLTEIYGKGSEAIQRVAMMGAGALAAGALKILEIVKITKAWAPDFAIRGASAKSLSIELEPNALMFGVGGLIGFRAGASMLVGSIIGWVVIAPLAYEKQWAELTTRESLVALPEGVTLAPEGRMQYRAARHFLEVRGEPSAEDYAAWRAMSPDPTWQAALAKLELRTPREPLPPGATWETSVPFGAALPSGTTPAIPDALAARVRLIDGGFVVRDALTSADASALLAANGWMKTSATALASQTLAAPPAANFSDLLNWLIWPGVTLMVVSSLVSFSFSWRSMMRAFRGSAKGAPVDDGDLPRRWFILGCSVALVVAVACQMALFGITWWAATIGVLLSFVLAIVASRVSGETNITPIGAMGKVTQLVFGVLAPKDAIANLMAANVTGGAASQCADLMHDFKCGYLLGGSARKQFVAQLCGAFAGAIVGSLFYLILVPDPAAQLLTEEWAAPAVAAWKAVAEVFLVGLDGLPPYATTAILVAAMLGILLPLIEHFSPKGVRGYLPSSSSLGLAMVIAPRTTISLFLGALVALCLMKAFPNWSTRFLVTICAGIVVGDSLVGAGDAVWQVVEGVKGSK
ncbi:MAG: OPT/YSL family transporter [Phycisphaerae bacterium]|nr:OPT/YSL family transporter [Phycisphaerae bacterium]